jgi:photosystem II stability/assembly factor-like uncharacterized protein
VDGGAHWTIQNSGTRSDLTDVCFTDINTGTVVGDSGVILRTTDGGMHWMRQTSGSKRYLLGVSFTDAWNGTVVGSYGTILRTTDGGTSWTMQTSGSMEYLTGVAFTDAEVGYSDRTQWYNSPYHRRRSELVEPGRWHN